MRDSTKTVLVIAGIVAFFVFSVWFSCGAPCGMYAGVPLKDVPLRCLPGGDR